MYDGMEFLGDVAGAPPQKDDAAHARSGGMAFFKDWNVHTTAQREK